MKILVLGDSHTELQYDHELSVDDKQTDHSWLHHVAREYPQHEFISYAKMGESHLYYDMCVKHAITEHTDWDCCIVQWTSDERFLLPISDDNDENQKIWRTKIIHDNAKQIIMDLDHCKTFAEHVTMSTKTNVKINKDIHLGSSIPYEFTKLFKKSFKKMYKQFFKKIVTFSVVKSNTTNDAVMFDHLIAKYGKRKFVSDFLTPTLHLHYQGSKMAVEDFIKPFVLSKIL